MTTLTHHFEDFYTRSGLEKIHRRFEIFLKEQHRDLFEAYERHDSNALIPMAEVLESFLLEILPIKEEVEALRASEAPFLLVHKCKRVFVQRRVGRLYGAEDVQKIDIKALRQKLSEFMGESFTGDEVQFARHALSWARQESAQRLAAEQYAAWALYTEEGRGLHASGILFHLPQKRDYANLIGDVMPRARVGFEHTDDPLTSAQAIDQADYCIGCHTQKKDSCRTGFENQKNPLGVTLEGCPLDQKISEMMILKREGYNVGALAMVVLDNPMVALTGRRICNACSKACIFQKQEPVDIPSVETQILERVLDLPWGFEIYSLLTRWNPLNFKHPLPKTSTNKKVLVAGMGPSGIALSHLLLRAGHTVVGIEGMKIEPLPAPLEKNELIQDIQSYFDPLDERTMAGFGGVAEYGITVRWNKNFLLVVRLILERQEQFALHGNVRLESTVTTQQAFDLGFDHVALCMGAGKPNVPMLKNNLAKGVRQASDFLMQLQLTGAAHKNKHAKLALRLPIVVVGAGLTAVDAATEAAAYYVQQCLKGKSMVPEHMEKLQEEQRLAKAEGRYPCYQKLLQEWGGVRMVYRRTMQESPAYRLNHEELQKAFEEGIEFVENKMPVEVLVDEQGTRGLRFEDGTEIPARTILLATGTNPNTVIAEENPEAFSKQGKFLRFEKDSDLFVHSPDGKRHVSALGDLHPDFTGSVVHALASAKKAAPLIDACLSGQKAMSDGRGFLQTFKDKVGSILVSKEEKGEMLEVVVRAPLAASNLRPGHFFRLQAYEHQTQELFESTPLMGVPAGEGYIAFHIKSGSRAARLFQAMALGENVALMGPTGSAIDIPQNQKVLLVGGHKAALTFIGEAMEAKGCDVSYNATLDQTFQSVFVLGSADTMQEVLSQRDQMQPGVRITGLMPSTMQCMMKGICAQCLQRLVDPETGQEQWVFSCQKSIQPLDSVDFGFLVQRCS